MARILIACEESQATTKAFRKLGHEAFSCDLLPCSGGHPEWHFQEDIFEVIKREPKFDLMVAHPPCTYLTGSGVQWLSHPEDKELPFEQRRPNPKYPNRRQDMLDSVDFVKALYNTDIEYVVIENPVGLLSSRWRKPDQIIQPYMFGDEATKTTCLWLKNLPHLLPTNIVGKGERTVFSSGKSHPKWYADALKNAKTKEERQTLRSKTFPGMAEAFATQWGNFLK
jgi:site-specific DNA-cytosine methylase